MNKAIFFDMDGTIADLYGVDGWLDDLRAERVRPYAEAKGIGNLALIARLLNKAQKKGHEIGIISWGAKNASGTYLAQIAWAKEDWLEKHFPSVSWDQIAVVKYGMNKKEYCKDGILFDDEEKNREIWGTGAYEPKEIIEILKKI